MITRFARLPLLARLCAAFALVYLFGAAVGVTQALSISSTCASEATHSTGKTCTARDFRRARTVGACPVGQAQLSITMATSGSGDQPPRGS
ncbi:hypothetical protein ACTMU2_01930 [Cupriavidus basilensis]